MKIASLLSGGVDSSVVLALLKKQGHDCTAYYLKIWLEDDVASLGECPWEDDLMYAREVCEKLDIELKIINLQKEYWEKVVNYCIEQVKAGLTPNPDMLCNSRVKFAAFLDAIKDENYDAIATGHYAGTKSIGEKVFLTRVRDQIKDQTYFLANLSQEQVKKALFPLALYRKSEVRELAHKFDLPNKDRKDSQGICFLGKIKYNDFLKVYLKEKDGDVIDIDSQKIVAKHNGYWYYTIGQKKGFGQGDGPWIVVKKDAKKNIIYISKQPQIHAQSHKTFTLTMVNWIAEKPPQKCKVKLRHGPKLIDCEWREKNDKVTVTLSQADDGIAPGQYCVFYDNELCYGCGVIE